jgi:drug/metabolite transporter (DMT)-like permease
VRATATQAKPRAIYLKFIKRARARALVSAAVSALVLSVAAALHGEKLIPSSALGWTLVFLLGFVSHAMGQGPTSVALGRAPVAVIALIAWTVLGESMSQMQAAGGLIILAAVFLARSR